MKTGTKSDNKKPISLIVTLCSLLFIGTGIAYIGHQMRNKIEYYAGFGIVGLVILLGAFQLANPCDKILCWQVDGKYLIESSGFGTSECRGCPINNLIADVLRPLAILSGAYIIGRLILIHQRKENVINFV